MGEIYIGASVRVDGFAGYVVAYFTPTRMGWGDLVWVELHNGGRVDAVSVQSGRVVAWF